jgi:subtilisin family serine protease
MAGTDVSGGTTGNGQADQVGHGTEMASLAAGHGRNGDGVLGIAPNAKILPVKFSFADERGTSRDLGAGIQWAADHGAGVINISAGTALTAGLQSSVRAALTKDAVIVASIGNRSQDFGAAYPAAIPGVLAVGATNRSGEHADSSISSSAVQICAPGIDIMAAEPGNRYAKLDGTSPATAIVSGAAALVRAKFPGLSAPEVIHRLTATATDIGKPGRDDECGFGELNIVKALTANVPPRQESTTASPGTSARPTATTPSAEAKPKADRTSGLVFGGVLGAVLVGGLLAVLLIWRRKPAGGS